MEKRGGSKLLESAERAPPLPHPRAGMGGRVAPAPRTDQYLKHREVSSRYFRCPSAAGNEGVKNILQIARAGIISSPVQVPSIVTKRRLSPPRMPMEVRRPRRAVAALAKLVPTPTRAKVGVSKGSTVLTVLSKEVMISSQSSRESCSRTVFPRRGECSPATFRCRRRQICY